jgi:RNA polymerase sigma-B factor
MIEVLGTDEKGYEAVEAQFAAKNAALDERERLVLQLRFEKGLSQHEIGDRIGVSQMQVSRIMRRGLRKLLAAVQGVGEDGWE